MNVERGSPCIRPATSRILKLFLDYGHTVSRLPFGWARGQAVILIRGPSLELAAHPCVGHAAQVLQHVQERLEDVEVILNLRGRFEISSSL